MKKLALTLLLSLSIIVVQAGVLSTIKEAVSTVVSKELAILNPKGQLGYDVGIYLWKNNIKEIYTTIYN